MNDASILVGKETPSKPELLGQCAGWRGRHSGIARSARAAGCAYRLSLASGHAHAQASGANMLDRSPGELPSRFRSARLLPSGDSSRTETGANLAIRIHLCADPPDASEVEGMPHQ